MGVTEAIVNHERFNWKLPLLATVAATIVMLGLFLYGDQPPLTYIFLIVPIACLSCLFCFVPFVIGTLRKRPTRDLSMLFAVVVFALVSRALLKTQDVVRPWLRWLLWSQRLKAEVLAQPTPANGELKHIEWDSSGGTPVGDWTAYIVFDPTDSLAGCG
jgi:hypothetical protein